MRQRALIALFPLVVAIIGCSDDAATGDSGPASDGELTVVAGEPFPDARCDANRDAGPITFLTGFDYAAAASIVEVIFAEAQGYYDELCLDVELQASFSTANYPLVAGGQGQFASGGSFSEVVAFADANDADLVTVLVAGRTAIDALIVKPGVADTVADLEGTTIGVKGKLPTAVEIMLIEAGLEEGEDFETVLLDGFDPSAHIAIDSIVGFPGWKSNEPGRLAREGIDFELFDPTEQEIPGSFGAIFTSQAFIEEHPSAAEDFVRATVRGLQAAIEEPEAAATTAVDLVVANGNPNFLSPEGERFRWRTEAELIASLTPDRGVPGVPDLTVLGRELAASAAVGLFGPGEVPSIEGRVADLAAGVVSDGTLIWPG